MKTTEPNQSLEPTTIAVTECAPSRTFRASYGRGSPLTLGKNMKRPHDAHLFLDEVSNQIATLDSHSDVLALGYLTEIYQIVVTYGLQELHEDIPNALSRIYGRYEKNDSVRLHYLISKLNRLPSIYSKPFIHELEVSVEGLNMPEITKSHLRHLKANLEAYEKENGA